MAPRVKELWVQELVQARKLVIKKISTDDNPGDVGATCIRGWQEAHAPVGVGRREEEGELRASVLSVAAVVLQGCASLVHVEGTVTGLTGTVCVRVSAEMVLTAATGCLGLAVCLLPLPVQETSWWDNLLRASWTDVR